MLDTTSDICWTIEIAHDWVLAHGAVTNVVYCLAPNYVTDQYNTGDSLPRPISPVYTFSGAK